MSGRRPTTIRGDQQNWDQPRRTRQGQAGEKEEGKREERKGETTGPVCVWSLEGAPVTAWNAPSSCEGAHTLH
eukprot:3069583-Pyramimonas_sp.AAC.1